MVLLELLHKLRNVRFKVHMRFSTSDYQHDGHAGPLYIILPDSYAGPKEKFILKSFPDYKGWYGSMLSDKYVMYQAK